MANRVVDMATFSIGERWKRLIGTETDGGMVAIDGMRVTEVVLGNILNDSGDLYIRRCTSTCTFSGFLLMDGHLCVNRVAGKRWLCGRSIFTRGINLNVLSLPRGCRCFFRDPSLKVNDPQPSRVFLVCGESIYIIRFRYLSLL